MKRAAHCSRLLIGFGVCVSLALMGTNVDSANAQQRPPARSTPTPATPPSGVVPAAAPGEQWVQNFEVTELWSGPNDSAEFFGWLRKFSYLRIMRGEGDRYLVFNPRSNNVAWVKGAALGPSGPPPVDYLAPIKELARLDVPARLVGKANVYGEPAADDGVWIRTGAHNVPVQVEARVQGDGGAWYRLDSGEFVSGDSIRLPGPPAANFQGKWIDADLSEPTMVTAYEGDKPVASALAIRGVSAWQTPVGTYRISRRVFNETMSSEGLGIPRNAPDGYYVENVLYTQYFTSDGAAIHYNYWSSNFGYAGSHGCLGMNLDDSVWFWNWATVGTPIVVHY